MHRNPAIVKPSSGQGILEIPEGIHYRLNVTDYIHSYRFLFIKCKKKIENPTQKKDRHYVQMNWAD